MRGKLLKRIVVGMAVTILLAACGPLHELPYRSSSEGPYVAPGNEFTVEQPAAGASIGTSRKNNFFAVDFLVTPGIWPQEWYAVEWTTLPEAKPQSDKEFYDSWESFLPRYLAGNFGDGHYDLLHKERGTFKNQYPTLTFVGVGKHNGGRAGSIYGTAIGFGKRVGVVYVLRNDQPKDFVSFETLPGFATYERFVQTLNCVRACGK